MLGRLRARRGAFTPRSDTGGGVQTPNGLRPAFPGDSTPGLLPLSRLAAVSSTHALTVHGSQGNQYEAVTILLPPAASPILTRELLYTGVTRASHRVRVIATEDAVRAAVGRRLVRASGLRF